MQTLALAGAIALGILIGMGFPKLLVELGGHALEKLPLCHQGGAPMTTLTDDFAYEVLSVVAEIPEGRVATYGQIARLVGSKEKNARLVAKNPVARLNIMAISLSSRRQPRGAARAALARTGIFAFLGKAWI